MELMLKRVNGEKSRLKDKDRSTSDEDEVNEKKMEQEVQAREMMKMGSSSSSSWVHLKSTRERSNTFLVVATLIISVSFTATFTPPGDYKEDSGIPNFISTSAFRVFMICNHFAFLAAVTSAINVIIGMNVKRLTDISLFIGGLHILLGILWMCGAFFAASVEVQLSCLLKPTESEWMWLIVRRMLEVVAVPLFPVIAFYTMKFKAFSELQILCFHLFSSQQTPQLDYTI